MSNDPQRVYQATLALLKPALERVVKDPAFRQRLEERPLEALLEVGIQPDDALQAELVGKRFSEFWAARREAVEGPVETRDLPPEEASLRSEQLEAITGGLSAFAVTGHTLNFAPPYVPVGPVVGTEDPLLVAGTTTLSDPLKR
jgi:hypothetical protein